MISATAAAGGLAAAVLLGMGLGGAGVGYVRGIQVDRLKVDKAAIEQRLAERDEALTKLETNNARLVKSVTAQNGAIEKMIEAGRKSQEEAEALREQVRQSSRTTLAAISSLAARMQAPRASEMTCRDALAELRAELLR
jgi:uncharacterized protein HemX